ncbi:AmmeMemoRadiSam system protein A [Candidatus Micrarchaeota archaeon]|nr:AmmeMemoRadiSam system protein A [Candidatus Micrarchaeota archaeon]MBU1165575.1 AmmeMemoRadiSam system protein A [Candidatus Micrarchaeota archaeon]MBU1887386.1 AmmeMemoRadiSam system protein A [Candidatus Micrarchaeota archaeon]
MFDNAEKIYLLALARNTIKYYLDTGKQLRLKPQEVSQKKLVEEGACFVTMYIGKELRGCVGTLEAHQPLVFDVIENAINAAFRDSRFYPLTKPELSKIKISISVLTPHVPFDVKGPEDLLMKLVPGKHGLIMQRGLARATFLPAVWEQLPKKEEFLKHLSMKAGLSPDGWKGRDVKYFVYESEEFSE